MNSKTKGFTLIEIILAISVGIVVIAIAYTWINISNNSFNKSKADIAIRNDIRILNEFMTRDIQKSQEVVDDNPFVFEYNIEDIKYYYDEDNKAIVREINGKEELFLNGKISSFNLTSNDMKVFNANINIWDKHVKDSMYNFSITRRVKSFYDEEDDDDDDEDEPYVPTDHGYLTTLAVGNNPAGGVVVIPNENIKPSFYKSNYEYGFDIIVEDMPGNQGKFRITVFGYTLTYNYDILDTNKKVKAMYIENLDQFDKDIQVHNYSSYHVNIGYENNKKVEIPSGRYYKYIDGKWKKKDKL